MKKILIAVLSVAAAFVGFLSVPHVAKASTVFNTNSHDLSTFKISNFTDNPTCSTCWSSSTAADPNEIIAVEVYYHNSGTQTAQNTYIRVAPQGSSTPVTNFTFGGGVGAANAPYRSGSAGVSISGGTPQTLTFIPGSVKLYKDQSGIPQTFSAAQELQLFSGSGLPIGDILSDSTCPSQNTFCHQGGLVAQFRVGNTVAQTFQCNDHIDNDADGFIDYPYDPGCTSYTDNSEYNAVVLYQCNDNVDNDNDGFVDYPNDPGCVSPTDNSEYNAVITYQCNDGFDNDNDGLIDYPNDPGCTSPTDNSEYNVVQQTYQCNDGFDNDNDGLVDYPNDPGCMGPTDNTEWNGLPACGDGQDNDFDGFIDYPADPGCASSADTDEYNSPAPACNNMVDDDQDGFIDYPQDPGCTGPQDTNEYNTPPSACSDQLDNDNDGLIDYPQDPGCTSVNDTDEYNLTAACGNGFDDDADGLIDFPQDPGCVSLQDTNEYNAPPIVYQCNDGQDNDGDGLVDYPSDPGCFTSTDNNEYNVPPVTYQCNNNFDDDADGLVDFPQDPGCTSATDNSEYNAPPVECSDGFDNDADGLVDFPQDPGCTSPNDNSEYNVNAYVTSSTQPATNITTTSATLNGTYATNATSGTAWFMWGTSAGSLTQQTPTQSVFGTSGNFHQNLFGLVPNTTYYYKACADTPAAPQACDGVLSFTTTPQVQNPPTVTTIAGSCNATQTSFTVNGSFFSNGTGNTTTYFLYGTNTPTQQVGTQTQTGTSGNFSYTVTNVQPNTTYYFQAVAQNNGGTANGTVLSCTTLPNVVSQNPQANTQPATNIMDNSATLNGYLTPGSNGNSGTYHFEYGTSYGLGQQTQTQNFYGAQQVSAQAYGLSPNTTYYFRLVVSQAGFPIALGSILSFTTTGYVQPQGNPPQVTTIVATGVAQSSAQLNGYLTNTGNGYCSAVCTTVNPTTQVWFDWGPTYGLGYTTVQQSYTTPTAFTAFLGNLAPNTTYYFQAVAQNQFGTARGNILSFTTRTTGPNIIYVNTGGGGSGEIIELSITPDFAQGAIGDTINYHVHYKNLSSRTLSNVIVRAALPKEVTFFRSTRGEFLDSDNTVTVEVVTLKGYEEGDFHIQGTINVKATHGEVLVATATLVYTNPTSHAQEEAIAYGLVTVTGDSSLLGLALFSGVGGSLLGILLAILIILLIVYIARRTYDRAPRPSRAY